MAITSNSYTGNGSTTLYSFTFPYLDTADVKVSLNGTVTTAYTFANATTIQFTTAPGAGVAIRIYRETDDTALEAVFSPGSSIRASDLNSDFDQLLYLGQESNNIAEDATTTANTALTTANTAISTANAATSTANTALSNSATAVSTANTASTNASNAVTTANTASSNASAAVTTANAATVTANSAASTAATALSTANTASSNASAAVSTANTASTNASNAVTTANTALSTANTASSNASTAVTTANNAVSTANGAASTASTALTTANAAISAVASAVIYTPVANLTALAALTPSNGDYFELTDSTGAEGSALITGVTVGLVGAPGLTFRLRYDAPPGIFTFLGYFANDSETRYLKFSGGTLTGQLRGDDSTSASTPGFAFDGDTNTGIGRPGADELALITGGTARLTIDPAGAVAVAGSLSQGGNAVVVTTDSRLSDTRVPTDGSVTNTKVAAAAAIDGTKISPNFGSQNITTTGLFSHALGTAGAPTITFTGDLNTGIYSPGADQVAISTNGTGRLFVNSSGSVGIGTSSPNVPLQVIGGATVTDPVIRATNSGGTQSMALMSGGLRMDGGAPIQIFQGGSEVARIDTSGRLGIGTTTPGNQNASASQLVVGNTSQNNGITILTGTTNDGVLNFNDGDNNSVRGYVIYEHSSDSLRFASNGSERFRCDSSGRLLVGTTTPPMGSPLLHVQGSQSTNGLICFGNNTNSGDVNHGIINLINTATGAVGNDARIMFSFRQVGASSGLDPMASIGAVKEPGNSAAAIQFNTRSGDSTYAERMRIASDGRLSLAVDLTANKRRTVFTHGPNDGNFQLGFTNGPGGGSDTEQGRLDFTYADSTIARIGFWRGGGAQCSRITVINGANGVYLSENATTWTSASDERLKTDLVPIDNALDKIGAARAFTGRYHTDEVGVSRAFLIAQDFQSILPEAVNESNPDELGLNYSDVIPLLVAALKESKERIETLEAKVAALETA